MGWRNVIGGTNRQKGASILLNLLACNLLIESQYFNVDGRIVFVNINFNSTKISLCNIYALNNLNLQLWFILTLNGFLCWNVNNSELILGGDWNVALEAIIDKSGSDNWPRSQCRPRGERVKPRQESHKLATIDRLLQRKTESATNVKTEGQRISDLWKQYESSGCFEQ